MTCDSIAAGRSSKTKLTGMWLNMTQHLRIYHQNRWEMLRIYRLHYMLHRWARKKRPVTPDHDIDGEWLHWHILWQEYPPACPHHAGQHQQHFVPPPTSIHLRSPGCWGCWTRPSCDAVGAPFDCGSWFERLLSQLRELINIVPAYILTSHTWSFKWMDTWPLESLERVAISHCHALIMP